MINYSKKQAGGTILGLIIGLIIGLGIAVMVAITIKNTPLPFVDRLGKTDRSAASGPVPDPNKPMYGNREPARNAAKAFNKKTEEVPPADSQAIVTSVKSEETKKAVPANKIEGKAPVEDKSTSAVVPGDKIVSDKSEEKFAYFLQAGAFLERIDAEHMKARLALIGFSANITERKSETGTLYRVRIGPFSQQETMNRVRTKLTDNGVDAAVVRMPR